MGIRLEKLIPKLDDISARIRREERAREERVREALLHLSRMPRDILRKLEGGRTTWLLAEPLEKPDETFKPRTPPDNYRVMGVDGSQMEPEKDIYPSIHILNIGKVLIDYGENPRALMDSEPFLFLHDEEKFPGYAGVKRMVKEVEILLSFLRENPPDIPTLCLLDGSLILWTLSGKGVPEEERRRFILEELVPYLDGFREMGVEVASYISLPRTREVVNLLRIHICPYTPPNCDMLCGRERKCDSLSVMEDRDLFLRILGDGERSATFKSLSPIVEKYYGNKINFFYLRSGDEVGRVEFPDWGSPDFIHSVLLEEIRKGMGYPIPLSEAHEEALMRREEVLRILEDYIGIRLSSKERAKRTRWI